MLAEYRPLLAPIYPGTKPETPQPHRDANEHLGNGCRAHTWNYEPDQPIYPRHGCFNITGHDRLQSFRVGRQQLASN